MDSRAKQRLTGAVILVAIFVLFVPELLTGPGGDKPAQTPPAEEGLRRYTIELEGQDSRPETPPPAAPPAVALPAPVTATDDVRARAMPGEAATPEPAPAAAGKPDVIATNPVKPAPAPATPTPAPAAVSSPAPAAPVATTPKPPTATPTQRGNFAVQLGSFGSRDNADRLVRDMNARGFTAFIAPIRSGGRELYRVRVGPERDRAAAEALAVRLQRIGQTGSVVPIS